jgi:Flp pilus assembly protein CpaB
MTEGQDNPFTNTRLLIAGIAFGVVGAILMFVWANSVIEAKTGGTVTVYVMRQDLPPTEVLETRHVKPVDMPGLFVQEAKWLVQKDQFQQVAGRKPFRLMHEGEPLTVYDFPFSSSEARRVPLMPGEVEVPVPIDPNGSPGEGLRIGDVINLTANLNFTENRNPRPEDLVTMRVLQGVQVKTINGSYEPKATTKISTITIGVSEDTSLVIRRLEPRLVGFYSIEVLGTGAVRSDLKNQIPPEALRVLNEKLGPAGVVR